MWDFRISKYGIAGMHATIGIIASMVSQVCTQQLVSELMVFVQVSSAQDGEWDVKSIEFGGAINAKKTTKKVQICSKIKIDDFWSKMIKVESSRLNDAQIWTRQTRWRWSDYRQWRTASRARLVHGGAAQGIPWRLADGYESHGEGCKIGGIPCFDQNMDHQERSMWCKEKLFMWVKFTWKESDGFVVRWTTNSGTKSKKK